MDRGKLFDWCLKIALIFLIDFDCRVKRVAITERDNLKLTVGFGTVSHILHEDKYVEVNNIALQRSTFDNKTL
jgi:hypothetical protein